MILKAVVTEAGSPRVIAWLHGSENSLLCEELHVCGLRACVTIRENKGLLSDAIRDQGYCIKPIRLIRADRFRRIGGDFKYGYELTLEVCDILAGRTVEEWADMKYLEMPSRFIAGLFEILRDAAHE